ncbi:Rrf2 family transcriptional regulator [Aquimarina sp. ERC-38]|uniref:Rrf2 family transcriptional regulator n=1 Tax=Aquimarina sp. ERC-38 TaxID=2949996 RepID=UPI002246076F|nr:Rrf2 family transcriptional regulator [Aquimarina sp. ERC-38]UZO79807.1 Rrf2 family transcriptional regulator [Aquimarina sp. ERC-38]
MVKTRFSIALHILTLLAMYKEDWLTSGTIASSLNMNPVLVRKELATLKKGEMVESKEGKNGGIRLLKDANTIYLSDIFNLVKGSDTVLSLLKNKPNPNCKVGKQINTKLSAVFITIDQAVSSELQGQTLEEFKNQF